MATSRMRKVAAGGVALVGSAALASWAFGDDNHTKVYSNFISLNYDTLSGIFLTLISFRINLQKQFGLVMAADHLKSRPTKPLPSRSEQLKALQTEDYDVLVIGGGATGTGCALDSVSRGNT